MEIPIDNPHSGSVYLITHPVYGSIIRKENVRIEEAVMTQELSERFPEFIVKYYDYEDGNLFIEYVPSLEIRDDAHMLLVARSLLRVIHSLHEAGYLHRDICEDNMAVTEDGVKLYDFDSICRQETCDLSVIGHYSTDDYEEIGNASPEGSKELIELIQSNDYYAIGMTIEGLRSDNGLTKTKELKSYIYLLTDEEMSPNEKITAVNELFT